MSLLNSALTLAAKGFRVFPLRPLTKFPVYTNPFQRSTTNPDKIKALWSKQQFNIGIHLTGLLIIDIDGPIGEENFKNLTAIHECPQTAEVKTGNGRHLYYKLPDGVRATPHPLDTVPAFHSKINNHFDKIDIKGSGGLVAGAGSKHQNGSVYQWVNDIEPVPALDWMIKLLCEKENPIYLVEIGEFQEPGGKDELVQVLLTRFPITPGTRHDQTGKAVSWILGRRTPQEKAEEALTSWLLIQGRDDQESHNCMVNTVDRFFNNLETGNTYLTTDHQEATVNYYKNSGRHKTCFMPSTPLGEKEELLLQSIHAHVLYQVEVNGCEYNNITMTDRQLMRVHKLLHDKELSPKNLWMMKELFFTRGDKKATKFEALIMTTTGTIGQPSIFTCEHTQEMTRGTVNTRNDTSNLETGKSGHNETEKEMGSNQELCEKDSKDAHKRGSRSARLANSKRKNKQLFPKQSINTGTSMVECINREERRNDISESQQITPLTPTMGMPTEGLSIGTTQTNQSDIEYLINYFDDVCS